jgi:hypothetical protein
MNKKFFGIVFAFILISLPFKNVLASVNITQLIVGTRSVALLVTGLTESCHDFFLFDLKDSQNKNPPQIKKVNICKEVTNPEIKITFSELNPGNEYKVEVKEFGTTYESKFVTNFNDSDLNGIIKIVSDRLDETIIEGNEVGQYTIGSKVKLQTALTKAEYLNGNINIYTQSDIDIAAKNLRQAYDVFEKSKVVSIVPINKTPVSDPNFDIKNNGIVPRCNVGPIDQATGNYATPCDFNFFMLLVNNVIKYLLFVIATPLIALIIMYTAYLYLTAGGNSGQVEKVKHIFFNAVVGYVIALGAWLIINTIITSLNVDKDINTFMDRIE